MVADTKSQAKVPVDWVDAREHRRRLAFAVNLLLDGKVNSMGSVTLTANQATTTVTDHRVGATSGVYFMPTTANAAAEIGAGGMYVSSRDPANTQFVITHANNAQADRTFTYVVLGA